jgi:hypothetical protein
VIEKERYRRALRAFALVIVLVVTMIWAGASRAATARFEVSDLTVLDEMTGLVWSRNANPAGWLMSWDDAVDYVRMLNEQKYAGRADWKLPDFDEFKKFLAAVKEAGGVDSFGGDTTVVSVLKRIGFHNVHAGDYWSSTTSMYNDSEVWYVNMMYGGKSAGNKALYMCVWPVRREK